MCIFLTIRAEGLERDALAEIAKACSEHERLVVSVYKRRRKSPELILSREGGCGCLLADSADWNAENWDMEPEARGKVAETLRCIGQRLPRPFKFEALWVGDPVNEELRVTLDELAGLAATGRLGTRARYTVVDRAR